MKKPAMKKTMAIFEVLTGLTGQGHFFYVVADDSHGKGFEKAMKAVFERFNAKTSADLPKPFNLRRIDQEVLTA